MDERLIRPTELAPLDGRENLAAATVLDFWRWALGDLRMNNARGYLVEFLVARALGDQSPIRVEWGPYDVKTTEGTLVEVKSARMPCTSSCSSRTPSTDAVPASRAQRE